MTVYRINMDFGGSGITNYSEDVRVTDDGHLVFTDEMGKKRVYSRNESWTVVEVDEPPKGVTVPQ